MASDTRERKEGFMEGVICGADVFKAVEAIFKARDTFALHTLPKSSLPRMKRQR